MTQDSKQLNFLKVIRFSLRQFCLPSSRVPMRLTAKCLFLICGTLLLTACEQQQTGSPVTPVATEPDIVTVKLAQAADKASQALDSIAGIEQMKSPAAPPMEDTSGAPPNLMQPVTLRWSGPIEQVHQGFGTARRIEIPC